MKTLHAADWHVRDKDIDECAKVLKSLTDYATNGPETIDLIIVAGDLTDRNDVKLDSQTARLVIETISDLSHVAPVVIVTGTRSHDGNIPELMAMVKSYCQVYVATLPEQVILTGSGDFVGMETAHMHDMRTLLSFIPTPTKQFFDSFGGIEETDAGIGQAMSAIFARFGIIAQEYSMPHIMIGHWQVGGAYISETQQLAGRDIEISTDQILSANPSVACLGHIHMAQQIGKHPIFYSGSTYRKDFGEMEEKGFYVHEICEESGRLERSEWIALPSRKLIKIAHDYTAPEKSLDFGLAPLAGKYSDAQINGAHVRVEFKIWQEDRERIDKAKLTQALLDKGAAAADIQIIAVPRQNVRAGRVLEAERLRDKVSARAEIVGDTVPESILAKCDAVEEEGDSIKRIIEKVREAA